jgi:3-methylcrotonyl-CoA carboxylase beta subunit
MLWTWPNSRISVMGGEQAALVLSSVKRDGLAAKGETWSDKDQLNYERRIRRQYDKQGHPTYSSARLWDDGVIDPIDTRRVLGQGIAASLNNPPASSSPHGIFRM